MSDVLIDTNPPGEQILTHAFLAFNLTNSGDFSQITNVRRASVQPSERGSDSISKFQSSLAMIRRISW